jgi:hypothetical protein
VLATVLGGASDGADHWARTLLNPQPGAAGPRRYFRLQIPLAEPIPLDDASDRTLGETLPSTARRLISEQSDDLDEIVERLAAAGPIAHDR